MAVNLKSCYLYSLDNVHHVFIPTDLGMDVTIDGVENFIEKQLEKCIKNPAGRHAKFRDYSEVRQLFLEYRNRTLPFLDFANYIAERRFDLKDKYEIFTTSDLFVCEIEIQEVEYVACLELTRKTGITQQTKQSDQGVQNTIELSQSILPTASLKNACFFMINLDRLDITVLENMTSTEDDDTFLYADKILECKTEISIKEAMKRVRRIAEDVANNHKLNKLDVMKELEKSIKEVVNSENVIDVNNIVEEVFYNEPDAKHSLIKELVNFGIEKPIDNSNRVKIPVKKYHSFKTSTGIEIKVPCDYYNNADYIEFVKCENGYTEIRLENISEVAFKGA